MISRLCIFTDSEEPSGMGKHMLTLAAELHGEYHIALVCPPSISGQKLLRQAENIGLEAYALAAPYHRPEGIKALCEWLRETGVDIFHCHAGIGWEGFGGIQAARIAGVPIVIRTEHLPYLITHAVQQDDHQKAVTVLDRLLCVSEEAMLSYLKAGVPPAKLRVVQNGITPYDATPNRVGVRERLGLPADALLLTTVGRLEKQKGYTFLLEAAPAVIEQEPRAHFLWVGEGQEETGLRERTTELGLEDRILFLGRREDVPELLASSDLFVLPSIFEGLPLSVLEAMSAGLPVVGTQVCGTREVVVEGKTGRLVAPEESGALAEAIIEVLRDPAKATRWGAAGRQLVHNKFNSTRMARETSDIYQELLERLKTRKLQNYQNTTIDQELQTLVVTGDQ